MTDFPLNNWIPLLFDEKCYLLFLSYSWFWWSFNSEPFTSLFIIINPIIPDCRKRTKQNLHEVIFTCNSIIIIISLRTNKRRKMNYFLCSTIPYKNNAFICSMCTATTKLIMREFSLIMRLSLHRTFLT